MNKGSPDAAAQSIPPGKSVQPPADAETIPVLSPSPLAPDELAREQALAQTLVEEKDSESRTRMFSGPWANIVSALALAFSLFQLAASTFWTLDAITLRAVHILFLLTLSFLLYPALRREQRQRRAPTLYDASAPDCSPLAILSSTIRTLRCAAAGLNLLTTPWLPWG